MVFLGARAETGAEDFMGGGVETGVCFRVTLLFRLG